MVKRHDDDRLADRNGAIWRAYVSGATQEAIAAEHGISRERISQILTKIRDTIPDEDRTHLIRREADFLDQMRRAALDLFDKRPIPAYSNGRPIEMPDGTIAEDHSGRLAAFDRAVKVHERLTKLLGLDAPAKADVSLVGQERDATAEAAAAALAFLDGAEKPEG